VIVTVNSEFFSQRFFFFLSLISHNSNTLTLTSQTARAQSEKHCRRRSASSDQKTRRGIEGEKPGRRRYREGEDLLPERSVIEEKSSERPRGASLSTSIPIPILQKKRRPKRPKKSVITATKKVIIITIVCVV